MTNAKDKVKSELLHAAIAGGPGAVGAASLAITSAADVERLRHEEIEQKVKNGEYPRVSPRTAKKGRVVPFPSILLRVPLFKFSHKSEETFTVKNPLRLKTIWGLLLYVGPALCQRDLTVLAASVQVAGTQFIESPRYSMHRLRLVKESGRRLKLEDPVLAEAGEPHELLKSIIGSATLSEIANCAFGNASGKNVSRVRASLIRLWDGHFFVQTNVKKGRPGIPEWLQLEESDSLNQETGESSPDDLESAPLNIPADISRVVGYRPEEDNSTFRRFPFFDLVVNSNFEPGEPVHFMFSPFLTSLFSDRVTYLDLGLRDALERNGMAQQLHALLSTLTSRKEPEYKLGFDKLYALFDYDVTITRRRPGGEVYSAPDRGGFRREIEKRCKKLEEIGFLSDWGTKPLADTSRDGGLLRVRRRFDSPADRAGTQDQCVPPDNSVDPL